MFFYWNVTLDHGVQSPRRGRTSTVCVIYLDVAREPGFQSPRKNYSSFFVSLQHQCLFQCFKLVTSL